RPSACSTSGPKAATTSASAGWPGSTTARAARSASAMWMPRSAKARQTADLPAATPPVTAITRPAMASAQAGPGAPGLQQLLAPHELAPAGDGQEGAIGDGRRPLAAAQGQPGAADHRPRHRRDQHDRQDAGQAAPGAQRRQQLEVAM